jgi:tetratricopeptide (TPR) repeat protein
MAEPIDLEIPDDAEPTFDAGPSGVAAGLDAAQADPELRPHAAAFFDAQTRLIADQRHHLHIQLRQLHLRTLGEAFKVALQGLVALAVLGLIVGVVLEMRAAVNDHGLVVEGFTAPPDLAARGLTGEALADDFLGRMAAIRRQSNAKSVTLTDDVRSGGGEALKVELPETGLSFDQVDRFLHAWLGHARRLNGRVRETAPGKVAIDIDLSGADPISVEGSTADLDGLLQRAAEQAFAAYDPTNHIIYLLTSGRGDEAMAAARRNVASVSTPFDLANALTLVGVVDGNRREALDEARAAIALDPKLWDTWDEAATASSDLGHESDALAYFRHVLAVNPRDQWRRHRAGLPMIMRATRAWIDDRLGDYSAASAVWTPEISNDVYDLPQRRGRRAIEEARAHDCAAAAADIFVAETVSHVAPGSDATARRELALCRGDPAQVLVQADTELATLENARASAGQNISRALATQIAINGLPWRARALAMTGDLVQAKSLINDSPTDCYFCLRTRALVAEKAGDVAGAEHWYGEAVRQNPTIPIAYDEWGRARLARGDLVGAMALFQKAGALGPRFADPLKDWGDALARQGHWREAITKYDAALRAAPAWAEAQQARAAAVAHT